MRRLNHKPISWGLPLLVVLALPANTFAFTRTQNASGTVCNYWTSRNLSYWVNQNCSNGVSATDCYAAVQNSIHAWNGHPCSDLVLKFDGATSRTAIGLDCFNLIVWRESTDSKRPDGWKYDSSVIALTTVSYDTHTGEIFDADVEVNGADYNFAVSGASDAMDIQNTLTHELGHSIGLDHSCTDPTNVMCPTANPGETTKRILKQDDINGLCYIYPAGEKTPLCSGQQEITLSGATCPHSGGGGCMTTGMGLSDIFLCAVLILLIWLLRISFPPRET